MAVAECRRGSFRRSGRASTGPQNEVAVHTGIDLRHALDGSTRRHGGWRPHDHPATVRPRLHRHWPAGPRRDPGTHGRPAGHDGLGRHRGRRGRHRDAARPGQAARTCAQDPRIAISFEAPGQATPTASTTTSSCEGEPGSPKAAPPTCFSGSRASTSAPMSRFRPWRTLRLVGSSDDGRAPVRQRRLALIAVMAEPAGNPSRHRRRPPRARACPRGPRPSTSSSPATPSWPTRPRSARPTASPWRTRPTRSSSSASRPAGLRRLRRPRHAPARRQPASCKQRLGTRKASLRLAGRDACALTGMAIGGVTAVRPARRPAALGRRRGHGPRAHRPRRRQPQLEAVIAPPSILLTLPGVEVVEGLANPVEPVT